MKFAVALLVSCVAVAAVNAGGSSERCLKKWAVMKAFESCVGKDNLQKLLIKKKKAFEKCSGQPAPEIRLLESPFRAVSGLVNSAMDPMSREGDAVTDEMMKKFFFRKMMEKMFKDGDDDFDFKRRTMPFRFRRDAEEDKKADVKQADVATPDDKLLQLGDKLQEKLKAQQAQTAAFVGNFTCILRECGTINADNDLDLDAITKNFDEFTFPDPWLKTRVLEDVNICYKFAQNLPEEILNECSILGPKLTKAKHFKKCLFKRKFQSCKDFDIKKRVEEHFGDFDKLKATTGLNETTLLGTVQELIMSNDFEFDNEDDS